MIYFIDITERKTKEISREQKYQSLFVNNPDAVYSLDLNGRYVEVNKAVEGLTGYSQSELLGSRFNRLITSDHFQEVEQNFKKATQGIPQNFECTIIHKDGKLIPLLVANIPIIIEHEVVGVYAIVKDVSLLKDAVKNLENSEKLSLVGQLSAAIAHEIRNPLTTLKGFLELNKKTKNFHFNM